MSAIPYVGKPEVLSTDQGSQFTGQAFTGVLAENGSAAGTGFRRHHGAELADCDKMLARLLRGIYTSSTKGRSA